MYFTETFWRRYHEVTGFKEIIERIDNSELARKKVKDVHMTIAKKLKRHNGALRTLGIQYGATKGISYADEEDVFLLLMLYKHGFGAWDDIRCEVARSPLFRKNWFLKSRNVLEVKRRCETLISLLEKEVN